MRRNVSRGPPAPAEARSLLSSLASPRARPRHPGGSLPSSARGAAVLVTSAVDELEIAEAAWRILKASGGVVGRKRSPSSTAVPGSRLQAHGQRHFPQPVRARSPAARVAGQRPSSATGPSRRPSGAPEGAPTAVLGVHAPWQHHPPAWTTRPVHGRRRRRGSGAGRELPSLAGW